MRRVLLVTYFFPPLGGGGVLRPLKLAKYLPEFGWAPHVLTVRDGFWSATDETPLAELGTEVRIHRTRMVIPGRFVKRALGRGNAPQAPGTHGEERAGLAERAKRVFRTIAYVPDEFIGWLPFALREGTRIVAREGIEAVISTSPPHTAHLVGRAIARRAGLPWIADFRDGWTRDPGFRHGHGLRGWVEGSLERSVVASASRIVAVTEGSRRAFLTDHPFLEPSRIDLITNGFDPDDYAAGMLPASLEPEEGRFRVVYTGGFFAHQSPRAFCEALGKLESAGVRLEAIFAGTEQAVVHAEAERAGVSGVVRTVGYLASRDACALQHSADALLLLLADRPGSEDVYPGKIFQYLGAGRPILAMVPEGAAADLVRKTGGGIVVGPSDASSAARALIEMVRAKEAGQRIPGASPELLTCFTRREIARRFATLLEEVAPCPS